MAVSTTGLSRNQRPVYLDPFGREPGDSGLSSFLNGDETLHLICPARAVGERPGKQKLENQALPQPINFSTLIFCEHLVVDRPRIWS